MKVAIVNFSGNVGKTTVANHLLKPRMRTARSFSIESINLVETLDGTAVETLRGEEFFDLQLELMQADDAIVDVGASNVEDFLERMKQTAGSHGEFDFFVVPAIKETKQQADTVSTLRALQAAGIPSDSIRVLLNKVGFHDQVRDTFGALFALAGTTGSFRIDERALIWDNEVFSRAGEVQRSVDELVADETDYRSMVRTTEPGPERDRLITLVMLRRLALSAKANLDEAYAALFAS
jgi:hypothetical protein